MANVKNVTESGFDISNIIDDFRELDLEWNGHPFKIGYNPGEITPNNMAAMTQRRRTKGSAQPAGKDSPTVAIFVKVVKSWSLTRKGEPVEISEDEVAGLSSFFLNYVMDQIMDDQMPGEETGSSFDNGWRRG